MELRLDENSYLPQLIEKISNLAQDLDQTSFDGFKGIHELRSRVN